jgi:hypothetical protein
VGARGVIRYTTVTFTTLSPLCASSCRCLGRSCRLLLDAHAVHILTHPTPSHEMAMHGLASGASICLHGNDLQ